nr:TonB-dependent receptor [Saprospiraceae bacterium]
VVKDTETGETLIGATVFAPQQNVGTVTNEYGFYSLNLASSASEQIIYSYVGYTDVVKNIPIDKNTTINITLSEGQVLQEVEVVANSYKERVASTQMSVENISIQEAKQLPVIFGEVDILKTLQLKPGILRGSEGNAGFFVRGGSADQNLIILDEATVYNANHLFGFFSTFNSDAIKDVKVYKGGFPAQYGGRLSSVIDVKLNDGNNQKFSAKGGIGLIASRLTLESPMVKGKGSIIVSGRRTYADIITRSINKANENKENYSPIPDYYFYDLNIKANYQLTEKDRLFVSGYFGRDKFGFSNEAFNFNFDWGNATGTVRWNHTHSAKLFSNTTATFSDYQYNINNKFTGFSFNLKSNIRDVNLKSDFYYVLNSKNDIRFGASATYHQFIVGRLKAGSDDGKVSFSSGQDFDGAEFAIYGNDDITLNKNIKLLAGLRVSGFSNDGEFFTNFEPRAGFTYLFSDRLSAKLSYARMAQYVHLISSSSISLPTDVWYPSTKRVKPQVSDQVATGFSYIFKKGFMITNEYYYKHLDNQIDFKNYAELFANDNLEGEFTFGRGYAYGTELLIEKNEGKLTGWIGYTLSWTKRGRFPDILNGAYFSPRNDRRHDLSVVATYALNRRWAFSGTYVYGSGDVYWLPTGRFAFQDVSGSQLSPIVPVYEGRNNFRLAPYQRLDLSVVIKFYPKWGKNDLTISIYNVLNRRNPYFVYLNAEFERNEQLGVDTIKRISAKQVSLFPILPALTWNFEF